MKIYKLTSSQTDQVYVGKTTQTLKDRFYSHKSDYNRWLNGLGDFKSSYFLTEYDDAKIELIEETNNSLREIYWIQKLNTVNLDFNGPNFFIYKQKKKDCRLGFIYIFVITRNKKPIIQKRSVDLEYLKEFRDNWLRNNPTIFLE